MPNLHGAGKERAILVKSDEVMEQVQQLIDRGLIVRRLMMSRCSLCNTELREATIGRLPVRIMHHKMTGCMFFWCEQCRKLYWNGSHGKHISERIEHELTG